MSSPNLSIAVRPILLRLSGPSIKDTFPIGAVSNVILSINGLLQNAYFVLAESEGLPPRWSKHQIQIMAGFPERGSIVFPIDIQLAATIASQISPQQILTLAKQASDLFHKITSLFKSGQHKPEPRVSIEGNNNTVVIFSGDTKISTDKQIAEVMAKSYPELKNISSQLDKDRINQVELEGVPNESLQISAASKAKLVKFPKPLRDEIVRLLREQQETKRLATASSYELQEHSEELEGSGDIISFNKKDRSGIINLVLANGIAPGEYQFSIRSHETSADLIVAMLESRVNIRFFPKVVRKKVELGITWIEKKLSAGA